MKAYTVRNVLSANFETMEFDGEWSEALGNPQLTGSWLIYGDTKHGKTTLAMMMAKYLTKFGKVAYNSVEEGLSLTIKKAMERLNMIDVAGRLILLDKEPTDELIERLKKRKSPDIIVIDSVQFIELKFSEYKKIKNMFTNKLFIYISHVEGNLPAGQTARRIWRDANVTIKVEGFKGFPISRFGGGKPIIISSNKADEYWGLINNK
jgi:hypothetical protein